MTKADNDSKENLEHRQDTLGVWFKIATAAVVFGLLFEYVPEIVRAWHAGFFPTALIGPIFITVGVAGELVFEYLAGRVDNKLRILNNSLIAAANERASKADLERVKLEARLADRHVNSKQVSLIAFHLREFGGRVLSMWAIQDNEAVRFSNELKPAFETAGIIVFPGSPFDPGGIDNGLALFVGKGAEQFADAVSAALVKAEVVTEAIGKVPLGQEGTLMLRIGPK